MEYVRHIFGPLLGRQKRGWADPIDIYCGEKDGVDLWAEGYLDEPYERFHGWTEVRSEKELMELKNAVKEKFLKRFGVPYNKVAYDAGKLKQDMPHEKGIT